jgi:hypothetical protein
MMTGKARGFDVSSKDGIERWVAAYNASLPPPLPRFSGPAFAFSSRRAQAARRNERKHQNAARCRNR